MKRFKSAIIVVLLIMVCNTSQAQFLNNLLNNADDIVTAVTGGKTITPQNLQGTWNYANPAVELDGGNVLTDVAGTLATTQLEEKLSGICQKVGIKEGTFSFTFEGDNSFYCTFKGRNMKGTYTIDAENSSITLQYSVIGKINIGRMTSKVTLSGSSLSLLFNADALLDFLTKISSLTKSESLGLINTIASKYEGVKLGFELER